MALYVISDLHIGAGELDDCDPGCEAALAAFVGEVVAADARAELVLNGDSFDFVQAQPWRGPDLEASGEDGTPLAFTLEQSLAKARSIIDAHGGFFDALAALLRLPGRRLTIMPGNHDADLFHPQVRNLIQARLAGPGGTPALAWHYDRVYRPERAPWVWIEHGHQFDPLNSFFRQETIRPVENSPADRPGLVGIAIKARKPGQASECWSPEHPPLMQDRHGRLRLIECIGTRFLIRYLNALDRRYPFVDNIKPFGRFLQAVGSSAVTLRGGSARAALSFLAFLRFAAVEACVAPGNLLSLPAAGEGIGAVLAEVERASGGRFSDALRQAGCDFGGRSFDLLLEQDAEAALRVLDFALARDPVLDAVALDADSMLGIGGGDDGMLSLARGFKIDETALLKAGAQLRLADPAVACVIMGHTHETVDLPRYKNTGSWTRYWQVPPGEPMPSWRELVARAGSLPLLPHYAYVSDDPVVPVELRRFQWPR